MPILLTKDDIGKLFSIDELADTFTMPPLVMYVCDSDEKAKQFFAETRPSDIDGVRITKYELMPIGGFRSIDHIGKTIMLLDVHDDGEGSYYKILSDGQVGYSSTGVIELALTEAKLNETS